MIVKEILEKTTQFFKQKNIDTPRLDSEILISNALGLRRIDLYLKFEQPLKEHEIQVCRDFVRRRSQGEPVAYILGRKDFYNLSFDVDKRVLVPRPETELLVEEAFKWMNSRDQDRFQVIDLGCGSGCIGLTIAKNESRANVTLIDASLGAVEVATSNQKKLELESSTTVINIAAEDFAVQENQFDMVLSNPPYIDHQDPLVQESVKKFEPAEALFSKEEGLAAIKGWSEKYIGALKPGGLIIFEIGSGQGEKAKAHFQALPGIENARIIKDLAGMDRFVSGEKIHG